MKQGLFYNDDLECQEYDSFKFQECLDIFCYISYLLYVCVAEFHITDSQN